MTPSVSIPARRGAALLIVLATLVLVAAAASGLARAAATARAQHVFDEAAWIADDLLSAAEAPIARWLGPEADFIVLPPTAAAPEVPVLVDRFDLRGREVEVRITAYDQCGMAPWSSLAPGSPLRLAIPADALAVLDAATPVRGEPPGLDAWADAAMTRGQSVFPLPGAEGEPALGAIVATHNPLSPSDASPRSRSARPILNIHTAPLPLLEQTMRALGVGGIERIVKAREAGRRTGAPCEPAANGGTMLAQRPLLAPSSNCWALRVDVRVGPVRRSRWAVHVRSANSWVCVQRLEIRY